MITSIKDYNQKLHIIYSQNPPSFAVLSTDEPVYDINTTTRTISVPEFLGVEKDHCAETIYFRIDRYVDYMDLTSTACMITYINADGETGLYIPRFYDVFTESDQDKILIPWVLDQRVTKKEGEIIFTIKFFKTIVEQIPDQLQSQPIVNYELNLLPTKAKVLKGLTVDRDSIIEEEKTFAASWLEDIQTQITEIRNTTNTTWIFLD